MKKKLARVIVIVGPTSSGKSDLALRLAKLARGKPFKKRGVLGAEIISADSRQVYKGLDIGTGKVTKKERRLVQHHLIDVASPNHQFTADDFKKLGEKAIIDIVRRGKLPIVVGGTGFYIDTLLGRTIVAPVPPSKKLRAKFEKFSADKLFKNLKDLDPQHAKTIDRHNKRRLVRALEIALAIKKPVATTNAENIEYDILWLGLNPKDLKQRIKTRLKKRLRQGMVLEVIKLHNPPSGKGVSFKRLHDLGLEYRWIGNYLQKKISRKEMEAGLYNAIVKYSKRQMTWFKRNKEIHWIRNFGLFFRSTTLRSWMVK